MTFRASTIIGAIICQMSFTGSAPADPYVVLTTTVSGATPGTGQILAAVFNSSAMYMNEPYRKASGPIDESGTTTLVFEELPTGTYAVSIAYDRNANGELDTNFLGIPTEPFGFSNNATALIGPPPWEAAKFALQSDMEIHIELNAVDQ